MVPTTGFRWAIIQELRHIILNQVSNSIKLRGLSLLTVQLQVTGDTTTTTGGAISGASLHAGRDIRTGEERGNMAQLQLLIDQKQEMISISSISTQPEKDEQEIPISKILLARPSIEIKGFDRTTMVIHLLPRKASHGGMALLGTFWSHHNQLRTVMIMQACYVALWIGCLRVTWVSLPRRNLRRVGCRMMDLVLQAMRKHRILLKRTQNKVQIRSRSFQGSILFKKNNKLVLALYGDNGRKRVFCLYFLFFVFCCFIFLFYFGWPYSEVTMSKYILPAGSFILGMHFAVQCRPLRRPGSYGRP